MSIILQYRAQAFKGLLWGANALAYSSATTTKSFITPTADCLAMPTPIDIFDRSSNGGQKRNHSIQVSRTKPVQANPFYKQAPFHFYVAKRPNPNRFTLKTCIDVSFKSHEMQFPGNIMCCIISCIHSALEADSLSEQTSK